MPGIWRVCCPVSSVVPRAAPAPTAASRRDWAPRPTRGSATAASETAALATVRSEEHTSELQSPCNLVCRLLLEKKKQQLQRTSENHRTSFRHPGRIVWRV